MKGVREEKILVPIFVITVVILLIFTSGVLTTQSPFIPTTAVSNVIGGKWTIQNYYTGNSTLTEILTNTKGDVLIITKYSFNSPLEAKNFFYSNELGTSQSYRGYLISYYVHGLSESIYVLDGNNIFYISYIATGSTTLPSIGQLINLIK